ncbi:MAG: CBS domain-containing protein, partial [Bdellovibrionales bacterium]|nr:CBS domain-containing protein [Bdellovibrionales bacterium]
MLEERLKALFGVKKQMKVGDYSSPATQTVSTGDLLIDISEKMEKNKIRHLPVFEGENLVGIVSHSTVQLLAGFQQELSLTAKEIMTRDPYVINFDTHLHDVLKYMMDK